MGKCKNQKFSKTFLEVASCNVLTGCMGKIYLRFQSLLESIKMLVINVYLQDISSQKKFILFHLYECESLLMFGFTLA